MLSTWETTVGKTVHLSPARATGKALEKEEEDRGREETGGQEGTSGRADRS